MIPRDVKAPTIPIPFHRLLKVVAIVDDRDPQTKELLDQVAAENFEIEVSDNVDRDVSEDASVGAYIALIDGDRLEQARKTARAVRAIGFETPLWGLANSHYGVPATVVANCLREQGVIPEKCDLNSILFLMTPAEDESKLNTLIAKLVKFKNLWDSDAALPEALPTICAAHPERYIKFHTYVVRE
jgi:hypothetical protein